jgi:DNA-directed RNA polymerase subunit K
MLEKLEHKFTRYEVARILGARSLQLSMDAPVLLKLSKEDLDDLNFDTLMIAERELIEEVLPITVRRPFPKKSERTVKKLTSEEIKEKLEKQAEKETKVEKEEVVKKVEKKINEDGEEEETEVEEKEAAEDEMSELSTPEDEVEEEATEAVEEI